MLSMIAAATSAPIYYLCTQRHAYTIGVFLGYYHHGLGDLLRIIPYEKIDRLGRTATGNFIFTDFERLSAAQLQAASQLHQSISAQDPAALLLNNPAKVPGRFDLLKRLEAAGLNAFDVHRLDDRHAIRRFPVFVRWESRHDPPLTGLLDSAGALDAAIAGLPPKIRRNPDLMIVEYGAVPSSDGRFRKYSAYKVGPTIYPQHCFINENWYIKFPSTRFTEADRAESRAYVAENPHASQIERAFDLAGIDYGRIDYGIVDGRVQTFEINSNPTVLARPPNWDAAVNYSKYAEMHAHALRALLRPPSPVVLDLGRGNQDVDRVHASAMRRVRRRIGWFDLRRTLSLRRLKKRLASPLGPPATS
ncbi:MULTISPECIES: hypothetical protein [unclassified Mesorhizobium]|uniref:hypothetical protein n=1 Tax=unclassified Mesorhizobium TaxID=325217 RepID=UPI001127A665|nr:MULTISPECIES: hypothetical protein [unclassified Mesorhizobium]TPL03120.1 hypothetical protein FJ567_07695 [Mesorhizobium sp. B2-4-16]TPL73886.1 hypothetical protein FJ956_09380 [Mesorhizobium sp. B2-4-3]